MGKCICDERSSWTKMNPVRGRRDTPRGSTFKLELLNHGRNQKLVHPDGFVLEFTMSLSTSSFNLGKKIFQHLISLWSWPHAFNDSHLDKYKYTHYIHLKPPSMVSALLLTFPPFHLLMCGASRVSYLLLFLHLHLFKSQNNDGF